MFCFWMLVPLKSNHQIHFQASEQPLIKKHHNGLRNDRVLSLDSQIELLMSDIITLAFVLSEHKLFLDSRQKRCSDWI